MSVVVNGLVLWLVPLLMIIGLRAALGSLVSISLGGLLALFELAFSCLFLCRYSSFCRDLAGFDTLSYAFKPDCRVLCHTTWGAGDVIAKEEL